MSILRYIKKLELLDALIRKKATGNQKEFCRKACMSRSHLNNYISEMRQLGFPIEYDKIRGTYYYVTDGRLVPKLFETLDADKMNAIEGGMLMLSNDTLAYHFDLPPTQHLFLESYYIGLSQNNFGMNLFHHSKLVL